MKINKESLLVLLALIASACSTPTDMSNQEILDKMKERNQKVMLEYGQEIIPPKLDEIPKESESVYVEPEVNQSIFEKIKQKLI